MPDAFRYPDAANTGEVGKYPALVKSGGGYFYDEILEYRVWIHPELGGEDPDDGDDYFYSFPNYETALDFYTKTTGAELPFVLILQKEHINQLSSGKFEHIKGDRITEWQPDWLEGNKREKDSISKFLNENN